MNTLIIDKTETRKKQVRHKTTIRHAYNRQMAGMRKTQDGHNKEQDGYKINTR